MTSPDQRRVVCPRCGKAHYVDRQTYAMFGVDTYCMKCVDLEHLEFMERKGRELHLTCTPGCRCGFGPGGYRAAS